MNDMTEAVPIACMLDAGSFKDRMVWIADLNTRALKSSRRDDLRLELEYRPEALADVRRMVAQEQECCAFLRFDLAETADAVKLAITAPESAREAAELVFGPFQEKTPQPAACGCVGGCGA
ncbi:MAG: hypothetical protein ACREDP_15150 [Bradyrhizobium sp.]